jgi:PhnB protein
VTVIQPELWVDRASAAVKFYEAAFDASVLHRVGEGDDIVVQLGVGDAAFWLTAAAPNIGRFSPGAIGGTTARILLIVDDPRAVLERGG